MRTPSAELLLNPADLAACRALLCSGSRTFHAASLVLPRQVRDPATALYAFCRSADDAIDLGADPAAALIDLRVRLDCAYGQRPLPRPSDRAFAAIVKRYRIPRELPEALLEGFEWDAAHRRYETLSALYAYAVRVAGVVGVMMTLMMGVRSRAVLARACEMGVAMQLTNIARDVGEDARAGRLYLPRAWMREVGLDPDAWLASPQFDARLATVVQRLLHAADVLYARAAQGIAWLPAACRPGMHAARLIYAEIGRAVEQAQCDSVTRRARVSGWRKSVLLAHAARAAAEPREALGPEMLREAAVLLDAVHADAAPRSRAAERAGKVIWLIELFDRLERAQRLERSG